MHVNVRRAGGVILVDLEGGLVMGDGDEVLHDVMDELLAEGWKSILLNLTAVERLDSAGVGELVASWKLAREFGADVKLLRPGDRVRHALHLSQILPLLEVFEDETAAVASFPTG
jgi:anti-sigma B factor antagonist